MLELHRLGHPATVPQSGSFDNTDEGKMLPDSSPE
jgi:hypothetical protein